MTNLFDSEIIHTYTRAEALANGVQIDVAEAAKEAGIRYPVFLTKAVYDNYVVLPPGGIGQDEAGRLWDLLWMLRCAIRRHKATGARLYFTVYVQNDYDPAKPVTLHSVCGPIDMDDASPAITVMLPDED